MSAKLIERMDARVFYAPTPRRRYLTFKSAVAAEARARMTAKHPTEARETDDQGRVTHSGWHWRDDERLCRVFARYEKRLRRAGRAALQSPSPRIEEGHRDV